MFEKFHLICNFSQCGVFYGDPCNKWNSISWNNVVLLPLSVPLWTLPRRPWVLISLSLRRILKFKVFQTHCDAIILTDRNWFSCALMARNCQALFISQSLNLSLSLRDRDRADTIITFHPPKEEYTTHQTTF